MRRLLIFLASAALSVLPSAAQNTDRLKAYDFDGALAEYRDSLEVCTDSLRREAFAEAARQAENGITMTEFCRRPSVVARGTFPADEFFLFYPLPDEAWHMGQDSTVIYYTGPAVDTLRLDRRDSLEFMPMVCGKDRYFASKDLPGLGGYDLFVCRWDERRQTWGAPRNLGFPFSTPYDDFLFINTADGQYSMFASNRDCREGMVNVYVVEYDSTPVCSAISDPAELRRIAALEPSAAKAAAPETALDEPTARYVARMAGIRELRDRVNAESKSLDKLRAQYPDADKAEKQSLAAKISEGEIGLSRTRAELAEASKQLQEMEMEFMMNGVTIDLSKISPTSGEKGPEADRFVFRRNRMGEPINFVYLNKE